MDYPTSSPYVTSVGGTSLAISKTKSYEWETSWGTIIDPLIHTKNGGKKWQYTPPGKYPAGYDGSGGGGVSTEYPQPSYQAGVVPTSLAEALPGGPTSSTPMRVIPDVSALADPSTGILVGQTTLQPNGKTYKFSLSRIGGTSVACPDVRRHRGGRPAGGGRRTRVRQPGDLLPGHALSPTGRRTRRTTT